MPSAPPRLRHRHPRGCDHPPVFLPGLGSTPAETTVDPCTCSVPHPRRSPLPTPQRCRTARTAAPTAHTDRRRHRRRRQTLFPVSQPPVEQVLSHAMFAHEQRSRSLRHSPVEPFRMPRLPHHELGREGSAGEPRTNRCRISPHNGCGRAPEMVTLVLAGSVNPRARARPSLPRFLGRASNWPSTAHTRDEKSAVFADRDPSPRPTRAESLAYRAVQTSDPS